MTWFDDMLGGLTRKPKGRARRISSNEQPNWNDGNFDMSRLEPGETLALPKLDGPGMITHLWLTSHAGHAGQLNQLSLRVYYDDREQPGVEVPVGDFFAVGDGPIEPVDSLPVQVSPSGALSCYWRMPFKQACRITVTNDHPTQATGLYWQVDWVKLDKLPADTAYFHARYRQEYPAVMARDYLLFEGEGTGHYVGTVMSVTLAQDGWFGEGDDFFYIDGEDVPSLQGTGSEDYFNDAWGFRRRSSLFFGQPRCEGTCCGDRVTAYRWHVLDPVGFQQSLRVTLEHKGNGRGSEDFWYLERPDFFSSIAYWYQTGEPKPFGSLPGWPERRVPWQWTHLLTVLRQAEVTGGPAPTVARRGLFGGSPALCWANPPEGARLTLPFTLAEDGHHALRLIAHTARGGGAFAVALDGQTVAERVNVASAEPCVKAINLGEHELTAGEHRLTFEPRGAGSLVAEYVKALRIPMQVDRSPKTPHYEGHFVRTAIGSAVYAWRLVHGEVPSSLDELVVAGYLDRRYLHDENDQPLTSGRRDGALHVRALGWEHAWRGLDARR